MVEISPITVDKFKLLPEPWSDEWDRPRKARVAFRKGNGFVVKTQYLLSDGKIVEVHRPRIMDEASEWGHSLYAGDVCWDTVNPDRHTASYFSEFDIVFLEE